MLLPSPHHMGILSSCIITGRGLSTGQEEILRRETDHIHTLELQCVLPLFCVIMSHC